MTRASLIFQDGLLGAAKKARGSMYSVLIGRQGLASDCADHEPREAGEPHTNINARRQKEKLALKDELYQILRRASA